MGLGHPLRRTCLALGDLGDQERLGFDWKEPVLVGTLPPPPEVSAPGFHHFVELRVVWAPERYAAREVDQIHDAVVRPVACS